MTGKNDLARAFRNEEAIAKAVSLANMELRRFAGSLKTIVEGLREAGGASEAILVGSMVSTVEGLRFELSLEGDVLKETASTVVGAGQGFVDQCSDEELFGTAWQEVGEAVDGLLVNEYYQSPEVAIDEFVKLCQQPSWYPNRREYEVDAWDTRWTLFKGIVNGVDEPS